MYSGAPLNSAKESVLEDSFKGTTRIGTNTKFVKETLGSRLKLLESCKDEKDGYTQLRIFLNVTQGLVVLNICFWMSLVKRANQLIHL